MLKASILTKADRAILRVTGHAGADRWGKDLVCAAASILTCTAAAAAGELYAAGGLSQSPRISLAPGAGLVDMENTPQAQQLLTVIAAGFRLLAARYPANVELYMKGTEEHENS